MTGGPDRPDPPVTIRTVTQASPDERPALPRRMTSAAEVARQDRALRRLMAPGLELLAALAADGGGTRAEAAIDSFPAVFERRPVRDNSGGSGFNDSLWLWVAARALAPSLILECGTHKGHSSWLFREACPEAEIHSFDITWDQLRQRAPGVHYHREDWAEAGPAAPAGQPSLAFFDDHISHARRILEAHARGYRVLLLDDNFGAEQLFATGGPPLPSLAMILDESLQDGREIAWTRNGKAYATVFREADAAPARALVARHLVLPELAPVTRQPAGSRLTLVQLSATPGG